MVATSVVIGGIQVVHHDFGQRFFPIQAIEVAAQRVGLRPIADGVETHVRPQFVEAAGIVVPPRPQVELLGPTLFGVQAPEYQHQVAGEARLFRRCGGLAPARPREDGRRFLLAGEIGERSI